MAWLMHTSVCSLRWALPAERQSAVATIRAALHAYQCTELQKNRSADDHDHGHLPKAEELQTTQYRATLVGFLPTRCLSAYLVLDASLGGESSASANSSGAESTSHSLRAWRITRQRRRTLIGCRTRPQTTGHWLPCWSASPPLLPPPKQRRPKQQHWKSARPSCARAKFLP